MPGRTDRLAVAVDGGDDLTHAAWEARSNAVARGVSARGIDGGGRIALLFDARAWAGFAVAWLGVAKAGAVPVLLSPGAARPDLLRALSHSGAAGLVCPTRLVPPGLPVWTADPDDLAAGQDAGALDAGDFADELVYPPAPLAPPRALTTAGVGLLAPAGGVLVHGWAPGSLGGQCALRTVRAGSMAGTATLATFDPEILCAAVEQRAAVALGLTPALAAALVASGAPRRHDVSSIGEVVLSGRPSDSLRGALATAFPGAATTEIRYDAGPAPRHTAPVAVSQEPMLWHEQFVPASFNLPCLVRRYQGALDVAALGWALSEIVRRHAPLRTTFAVIDGEPRQVAGDPPAPRLDLVDLGALPPRERDERVAAILDNATTRPFDLVAGPLFEPCLVRLAADDHLVVVRLHHTAFDDWSVDLFRRELSALYAARVAGAPSPLVEHEVAFADVARRQRARLAGAAGDEERAWWRAELAGAPLAVQLPIGPPRPGAGEPVRRDLPAALAAAVRALAPTLRATPYMTVLAAFAVLVGRTTGQDDLVLSTVVAHRNRSDAEPLIGCFTKKVPLRLRLAGEPAFADVVARARASLLGALSHQGLGFDAAVQEGLGRAGAEHGVVPQVGVVFQGETPQRVKLALPGLVTAPYEVPPRSRRERHFTAGPDGAGPVWGDGMYLGTFLILSLLETDDGMSLVARGVFDPASVGRLLADFEALLAELVADPSRPVLVPVAPLGEGEIELRGLRACRPRLEAALRRCPGVAGVELEVREVAGEPRLVAGVALDGGPPPSLADLRRTLWAELPGAVWPASADPLPADPDPVATMLAAMWAEIAGKPVAPGSSYWQDFSFLQALAEAREAGIAVTDDQVARGRTPEMLAAALRRR